MARANKITITIADPFGTPIPVDLARVGRGRHVRYWLWEFDAPYLAPWFIERRNGWWVLKMDYLPDALAASVDGAVGRAMYPGAALLEEQARLRTERLRQA